jgi:hypothetical protein
MCGWDDAFVGNASTTTGPTSHEGRFRREHLLGVRVHRKVLFVATYVTIG